MASGAPTSLLGRGRPARALPNPPKHQSSRSLVVPSSGPLSSGSGGFALTSPSTVLGNLSQASNLDLFLANLRILDLDLLEDWPDISATTFGSSAAGQKRRVQAVEWALFYLFLLWDPSEAQTVRFPAPQPFLASH